MIIIPAIDLKDGRCVRLRQGNMDEVTVFSEDPVEMAGHWVQQGCQRLHIVDLDGAFAGAPVNEDVIREIVENFPDLAIQVGGGIRSDDTIAAYLEAGVGHVILGTKAVAQPDFVSGACLSFPDQIIVGLDAREGRVAINGWAEQSDFRVEELAKRFEDDGVSAIVFTEISRDGMMEGANIEETAELARAISIPVIASGGVSREEDIRALCALREEGIMGAIVGRALYEGSLSLAQCQRIIAEQS